MEFKAQRKLFFTLDPTFEIDPKRLQSGIHNDASWKWSLKYKWYDFWI